MAKSKRSDYIFKKAKLKAEKERLKSIEAIFDPATKHRIKVTGIKKEMSCLEVGPGAGSIMRWLAKTVGPKGHVTAIDLNLDLIQHTRGENITMLPADISTYPLDENVFDLIHARYVLIHNQEYETIFKNLVKSLKPGGWIVVEEPDFSASKPVLGPDDQLESINHVNEAIHEMFSSKNMDWAMGSKLPAIFKRAGLRGTKIENDVPISEGNSAMARMMAASTDQLKDEYIKTGKTTMEDIQLYLEFAHTPGTWAIYFATVAGIGQKPGQTE